MKNINSQYFFALLFMGVGIYQMIKSDVLEASLYFLAGSTFILNALTSEARLQRYKKPLVRITWVMIIATGLLFLWVIQFKYL
jgi:hypothetical protein